SGIGAANEANRWRMTGDRMDEALRLLVRAGHEMKAANLAHGAGEDGLPGALYTDPDEPDAINLGGRGVLESERTDRAGPLRREHSRIEHGKRRAGKPVTQRHQTIDDRQASGGVRGSDRDDLGAKDTLADHRHREQCVLAEVDVLAYGHDRLVRGQVPQALLD